ncbi:MAG: hypothetical protein K2W82_06905 [Candidatus Obscuribacterales bacterium]|nr:hypothetical protein [Candidatus Obscuribacterales bacterium]
MKLNSVEPKSRVELSVVALSFVLASSFAFMPIEAEARRPSFQMPVQDQLTEGASPASPAVVPVKRQSLAPVGLNDSETVETPVEDASSGSVLKSSVSENKYVAKDQAGTGANAADTKAVSVVGKKELSEKVLKDGWKKVEVGPLPLLESDSELEKKVEVTVDAERRQLADLWNATMARNPDIQFVINKLQPTDNHNHAMANSMKALSTLLFSAVSAAPMFMMPAAGGNMMPMASTSMGVSMIQNLFANQAEKGAKKQAISQEQATILYKIIRDTADKLTANYRDYKKDLSFLERASTDLQDLQAMVAEARGGQDASRQVEMEYTLRKARREIDRESEEVRGDRQALVDLAGDEAVVKLDQELQSEREAIARLTGGQDATSGAEAVAGGGSSVTTFVNPLGSEPAKRTAATQGAQIH